jgi:hypothetical protein
MPLPRSNLIAGSNNLSLIAVHLAIRVVIVDYADGIAQGIQSALEHSCPYAKLKRGNDRIGRI